MSQPSTLLASSDKHAWTSLFEAWQSAKRWLAKRPRKKLHLEESLSLGEHRFLAVVDFSGRKFLIGGGSSDVKLLTELTDARITDKNEEA